jgi:hypothetical protein
LVDEAVEASQVLSRSVKLASSLKSNSINVQKKTLTIEGDQQSRTTLTNLKRELYRETITLLESDKASADSYGPSLKPLTFSSGVVPVDGSKKSRL